jgi:hypothetical protein
MLNYLKLFKWFGLQNRIYKFTNLLVTNLIFFMNEPNKLERYISRDWKGLLVTSTLTYWATS